ncbi:uncharacterized protein PV09_09312 [Verruconis gallopava]|uniref:Uncharacterized protein n=1 Tax=Verruconis gallopava TaxID=253628 RepID=A0A0D1X9S4_9PEZI|nr:uncharacterized protein PV09_09312 [Verruconis gallopava]KIV98925.1 hypothetical protein PV09_09312 [Verruconis gallopava]
MAANGSAAFPPPDVSIVHASEHTAPPTTTNTTTTTTTIPEEDGLAGDGADPLPRYTRFLAPFQAFSGLLLPLFLLPLSVLLLVTLAPDEVMSSLGNFFRGFILPALIALGLYLLLHFALLPLYRRHRARYSQYLPVHTQSPLATLSSSTSTLRQHLLAFLIPSRWAEWRWAHRRGERVVNAADGGDDDEEMGEDLEFDLHLDGERGLAAEERRRRDGLSLSMDGRAGRGADSDRRLSRELEEGFADSSDDEEGDGHGRNGGRG